MADDADRAVAGDELVEQQMRDSIQGISDEDKALADAGIMTNSAARELTEQIKATATATYVLIQRAHEFKAWTALGYDSWEDYVSTEFDMSKSRSYQLINQAKVVDAIQEAVPDGTKVLLTEAQARDVEKALPRITDKIKKATADQSPEEASKTVKKVVEEERAEKKKKEQSDPTDGVSLLDADELEAETRKQEYKNKKQEGGVAPAGDNGVMRSAGDDDELVDDDTPEFDDFDDTGQSVLAVGYVFAYFEGLGDPTATAEAVDNPKESLKNANTAIEWMTKFRDGLSKRAK